MRLEPEEITALADALAPRVADILERARLAELPELAMSVPQAAAIARLEEHVIRDAIADGRLPAIRIGRSLRIRRSDLFRLKGPRHEHPDPAGHTRPKPPSRREASRTRPIMATSHTLALLADGLDNRLIPEAIRRKVNGIQGRLGEIGLELASLAGQTPASRRTSRGQASERIPEAPLTLCPQLLQVAGKGADERHHG